MYNVYVNAKKAGIANDLRDFKVADLLMNIYISCFCFFQEVVQLLDQVVAVEDLGHHLVVQVDSDLPMLEEDQAHLPLGDENNQ